MGLCIMAETFKELGHRLPAEVGLRGLNEGLKSIIDCAEAVGGFKAVEEVRRFLYE